MVDHSGHGCEQVAGKETKRGERPIVLNRDRKSTRLNSSHSQISYAVFCLKKKKIHFISYRSGRPQTSSHCHQPYPVFSIKKTRDACTQGKWSAPRRHSQRKSEQSRATTPY